jgi:1-acyl-sn-glycerol-3-phosphate acyltransferase
VWIAPEGGWQPQMALRSPRTGAVRLAQMAGVPLQVLAIRHQQHPGPDITRWPRWTRPAVTLQWGPRVATNGDLDGDIDRVMSALAAATEMTWSPASAPGPDALPDRL